MDYAVAIEHLSSRILAAVPAAHSALHRWCAENGRPIGGFSLEIYGDWNDDPQQLETTIQYLLR